MSHRAAEEIRIGDLARRARVTPRTLRYYESLGLLQPAARHSGGFRLYDEAAALRLQRIRQLKELLGFSLDEVGEILRSEDAVLELRARYLGTEDADLRAELLQQALAQAEAQRELVRGKLAALQSMDDEIAERQRRLRQHLRGTGAGGPAAGGRLPLPGRARPR